MLWNGIKRFVREEDGLETVEWAVVGTAVILVAVAAFQLLGTNTQQAMNDIAAEIPAN